MPASVAPAGTWLTCLFIYTSTGKLCSEESWFNYENIGPSEVCESAVATKVATIFVIFLYISLLLFFPPLLILQKKLL